MARPPIYPKAPLVPEVAAWIASYRCNKLDEATWTAMARFVRKATADVRPPSISSAQKVAASIARLAEYCLAVGVPLTVKSAFHPDNIDSCLTAARRGGAPGPWPVPLSDGQIKQISSYNKRIGRALNPRAPWPSRVPQGKSSPVKAPLSLAEEAAFFRKARGSASVHQLALLVLGFGAGLDGRELPGICTEDVIEIDGHFWIRPSKPIRMVPLPDRYADDMRRVLAALPAGALLIGPKSSNRVSHICESLRKGLSPLSAAAMRSTWMVRHINNGCDIRYLAHLAGTSTGKTVWQIIEFAAPYDTAAMANKAFRA